MTNLPAPPQRSVPWRITTIHRGTGEVHHTEPFQTAFAAAASIRCFDGQQPHFSECDCRQMPLRDSFMGSE